MRQIAVAIGSNLGDRAANLEWAARELTGVLSGLVVSPAIETSPVGPGLEHDPAFLNAAAAGESAAPAGQILAALLDIEARRGRTRPHPGAPRTLDLDLILAGNEIVDEPGVQVPHPRFRERRFVLEPLASIAPDLRDPVTGLTIRELYERLAR